MIQKANERKVAIKLRKEGKTYNEILSVVPVSKSTLSLWLRSVQLSKHQNQRITLLKHKSQLRGAAARKRIRIEETQNIYKTSKNTLGVFTKRDLFILGIGLYWAEGTKEKEYRPSVPVEFANSDPKMIIMYLKWVKEFLNVKDEDIQLILHIHENHLKNIDSFKQFWVKTTGLSLQNFASIVIKKHNPKTKRMNIKDTYRGLLAIRVKRSTMHNRRIQGWIYGIIDSAQP
jgi:hypothetical protein